MTLVEPVSNGLGSDAFCILWDGSQLHGLNASGCAPRPGRPTTTAAGTAPTASRRRSAAWTRSPCRARSPAWAALVRKFFGKPALRRPHGAGDRRRRRQGYPGAAGGAAEVDSRGDPA